MYIYIYIYGHAHLSGSDPHTHMLCIYNILEFDLSLYRDRPCSNLNSKVCKTA